MSYRTFECRITDAPDVLEQWARLYGRVDRSYFRDRHIKGKSKNDLKRDFQKDFGITARHFNAVAYDIDGRVKSEREIRRTELVDKRGALKEIDRAIAKLEAKLKFPRGNRNRRSIAFRLHQKNRRRHRLAARVEYLENVERPRICFGSRKLFNAQHHLEKNGFENHFEWRETWRASRDNMIFLLGSKDETAGNQSAQFDPETGEIRLRLPHALAGQEKFLTLTGIAFSYGSDDLVAAHERGQALTWRLFRRGNGNWYAAVSFDIPDVELVTDPSQGAVGIDINPDIIAVTRIDDHGNPVERRDLRFDPKQQNRDSLSDRLGCISAEIVELAKRSGQPIVVEKLDFAKKKAGLRERGKRYASMLSRFAYSKFLDLLVGRAAREGVEIISVNPAYTSVIGKWKFSHMPMTRHQRAAAVIGRRGLRMGERLVSGSALVGPARNRSRHVWSDWAKVARGTLSFRSSPRGELSSTDAAYASGSARPCSDYVGSPGVSPGPGLMSLRFPSSIEDARAVS